MREWRAEHTAAYGLNGDTELPSGTAAPRRISDMMKLKLDVGAEL